MFSRTAARRLLKAVVRVASSDRWTGRRQPPNNYNNRNKNNNSNASSTMGGHSVPASTIHHTSPLEPLQSSSSSSSSYHDGGDPRRTSYAPPVGSEFRSAPHPTKRHSALRQYQREVRREQRSRENAALSSEGGLLCAMGRSLSSVLMNRHDDGTSTTGSSPSSSSSSSANGVRTILQVGGLHREEVCRALRQWGTTSAAPTAESRSASTPTDYMSSPTRRSDQRTIVNGGDGGGAGSAVLPSETIAQRKKSSRQLAKELFQDDEEAEVNKEVEKSSSLHCDQSPRQDPVPATIWLGLPVGRCSDEQAESFSGLLVCDECLTPQRAVSSLRQVLASGPTSGNTASTATYRSIDVLYLDCGLEAPSYQEGRNNKKDDGETGGVERLGPNNRAVLEGGLLAAPTKKMTSKHSEQGGNALAQVDGPAVGTSLRMARSTGEGDPPLTLYGERPSLTLPATTGTWLQQWIAALLPFVVECGAVVVRLEAHQTIELSALERDLRLRFHEVRFWRPATAPPPPPQLSGGGSVPYVYVVASGARNKADAHTALNLKQDFPGALPVDAPRPKKWDPLGEKSRAQKTMFFQPLQPSFSGAAKPEEEALKVQRRAKVEAAVEAEEAAFYGVAEKMKEEATERIVLRSGNAYQGRHSFDKGNRVPNGDSSYNRRRLAPKEH